MTREQAEKSQNGFLSGLLLEFAPDGTLVFRVSSHEDDFFFDEIGSSLQIKELRRDKEELLASLEMFYRVFFLNEETEHA